MIRSRCQKSVKNRVPTLDRITKVDKQRACVVVLEIIQVDNQISLSKVKYRLSQDIRERKIREARRLRKTEVE